MDSKDGKLAKAKIKWHDGSFEAQTGTVQRAVGTSLLLFEKGSGSVYTVEINLVTVDRVTKRGQRPDGGGRFRNLLSGTK